MFTTESINKKSILSFFNEKCGIKKSVVDNSQNKNDANFSGADVESSRYGKKLNVDILMISGSATKLKIEFVRQYNEKCLKFGFTVAPPGNERSPQPLCLVCYKIL